MKVFVYSYRMHDEDMYFEKYKKEYGIEIGYTTEAPTMENASLAAGSDYISIVTTHISEALVKRFYELGIKMISTRTVGYDHIDLRAAQECGMKVGNATYSPNCVADYTIMLMLMAIRKAKYIMQKAAMNDFSLVGNIGKELPDLTIGVLGTGAIGETVIRYLSGFGSRILAYDKWEKESVKQYAIYTDLSTIWKECDLITLHMPLNDDNYHMIDKNALNAMKDGVVIINTARGGLIDSEALIQAIESGKVGAAGLDVVENENGLYYNDLKTTQMTNREMLLLRSYANVIVTPHMAFYTENAVGDMVKHSLLSCKAEAEGTENKWRVL